MAGKYFSFVYIVMKLVQFGICLSVASLMYY